VASVQITPSDAAAKVGDQAPFVATALDADGNPIVDVTFRWTSSNQAVATIDQEGIATAVGNGKAMITVRTGTGRSAKSAQAALEITGGPVPAAPVVSAPAAPTKPSPTPPVTAQAAAAGPPTAPPRQPPAETMTLRYAPVSQRYRIQGTSREVRLDQAGASRTLDGTLTVLLSAALVARGDSLVGTLTLDDVAVTGSASLTDDFMAARGQTFRVVFSGAGRSLSIAAPDSVNDHYVSVKSVLQGLLPLLPSGRFPVGYAWADTVQTVYPWMGGTFTDQSRRRHTVVGWENRDGERALRVVVASDADVSGRTGRGSWGDPVDLRGSARDTMDTWVSSSGVALGGTVSADREFTVTASGGRVVQRSRELSSWTVTRLRAMVAARVTLAPGDASLRVGDRLPFLAAAFDSAQNTVRDAAFAWSSSNPSVVSVDQAGIATGVSPGLAIVRVRTGTGAIAADVPVQVTAAAAAPPAAAAAPPAAAPAAPVAAAAAPPAGALAAPVAAVAATALSHADSTARACDAGTAAACTDLGVLYAEGKAVTQDLTRARSLYQRACDGGNAPGCTNLGNMYNNGSGGPQDAVRARSLYQRGCDSGNAVGCNNLGFMYEHALGGPVDLGQARALYQRACDGGDLVACSNLGLLYAFGRGVTTDYARARALYQRACDGGAARGCTNLGVLYERGLGVSRDVGQARTLFQRACGAGDNDACTDLQKMGGR
jgi:TPR repeat protein